MTAVSWRLIDLYAVESAQALLGTTTGTGEKRAGVSGGCVSESRIFCIYLRWLPVDVELRFTAASYFGSFHLIRCYHMSVIITLTFVARSFYEFLHF